eukprot:351462-Chlamydomonas_euryale.AAC.10
MSLSDELPLTFNTNIRARVSFVAFASGLDVTPAGDVLLTYGAADAESRVHMVPVHELEALFTGRVAFREVEVPYESDALAPAAGADAADDRQQPEQQQQSEQQLELQAEQRQQPEQQLEPQPEQRQQSEQQQQPEQHHERRRRRWLHTVGSRRLGGVGAAPEGAGMLGSDVGARGVDEDDGCRLF